MKFLPQYLFFVKLTPATLEAEAKIKVAITVLVALRLLETGFFSECAGCNKIFVKNPGF